jgi:hypothetical protein
MTVLPADFILEKTAGPWIYGVKRCREHVSGQGRDHTAMNFTIRGSLIDHCAPMAYHVTRGRRHEWRRAMAWSQNVLGVYTHLHALGTPSGRKAMVKKALEYRQQTAARRQSYFENREDGKALNQRARFAKDTAAADRKAFKRDRTVLSGRCNGAMLFLWIPRAKMLERLSCKPPTGGGGTGARSHNAGAGEDYEDEILVMI